MPLKRVTESVMDGFAAADPGLVRFRFATRTVLAVALALGVLAAVGLPLTAVLLGAVAALVSSTSLRTGSAGQRLGQIALTLPAMIASLSIGTLLAPYRLLGDAVFLVLIFVAVYLRRFAPLGLGIGMSAFMAFFFALFLKAPPSTLPMSFLAIAAGLTSTAVVSVLLFAEPPTRELRRLTGSLRARMTGVLDEVIELVQDRREQPGEKVSDGLRKQMNRLHESALLIEDAINDNDRIVLAPNWRRQLTDVELNSQRLCIATLRAVSGGITDADRQELVDDLNGVRRYLTRDPAAVLSFDEDALLRRLATFDINGDAGAAPTEPAEKLLIAHRAIRELLIAIARIRRTVMRAERGDPSPRPEDEEEEKADDTDDTEESGLLPSTRQAIQCTVASALAMIGGELLSTQRWYWAVIASFVVFIGTTTRGELLVKSIRRVGGTLLGIVAGTVLATLLAGDVTLSLVLVLVCIYLGFYLVAVSYTAMTLLITIMLGLLYDLLGTFTANLLVLRLTETSVGAGAAILSAMVLLPSRTRDTVTSTAADMLGSVRDFLDDAIGVLVYRREADLIDAAREIDRQFGEVCTAAAPVTHALTPFRDRRNSTRDLRNMLEDLASAVRNLARYAEPGALAGVPSVLRKRYLIDGNVGKLIAVLGGDQPGADNELVATPALAPSVNARRQAGRISAGRPERAEVLRLRRSLVSVDRIDDLVCGIGRAFGVPVTVTGDDEPSTPAVARRHVS
jgi:uncharacterized membrane protein YccC